MAIKEFILAELDDAVLDFVYYNRKNDETLPPGSIEEALEAGEITVEDMQAYFESALRKHLGVG